MKLGKLALTAGVVSIVTLATLTNTAFAWHPKGVIVKKVQNITANGHPGDADDATNAVAAKPGDTVKYIIEVRNDGKPDDRGYNDMAKTVMTDTLPAGVELASNPAQRQITENIGLIKPGQKVTKEYLVKVTSTKNGAIVNTACFTGDSTANDAPQKGCNPAVIVVKAPKEPETPVKPETPKTPDVPAPQMPTELPKTGLGENILVSTLAVGAAAYAINRYVQSRRDLENALINR